MKCLNNVIKQSKNLFKSNKSDLNKKKLFVCNPVTNRYIIDQQTHILLTDNCSSCSQV